MNLPPNHNATRSFSDQSGAPSSSGIGMAMSQELSKASANAGTTSAQNAASIMDKAKRITAAIDTGNAQENATMLAVATAKGIQQNSGLPITNLGTDPVAIARQIGLI